MQRSWELHLWPEATISRGISGTEVPEFVGDLHGTPTVLFSFAGRTWHAALFSLHQGII